MKARLLSSDNRGDDDRVLRCLYSMPSLQFMSRTKLASRREVFSSPDQIPTFFPCQKHYGCFSLANARTSQSCKTAVLVNPDAHPSSPTYLYMHVCSLVLYYNACAPRPLHLFPKSWLHPRITPTASKTEAWQGSPPRTPDPKGSPQTPEVTPDYASLPCLRAPLNLRIISSPKMYFVFASSLPRITPM